MNAARHTPVLITKTPLTFGVSRREIGHRAASLGLAAVMTMVLMGSIDSLAVAPAPNSLLAQQGPVLLAAAPAPRA
jgi:hypothetical protein